AIQSTGRLCSQLLMCFSPGKVIRHKLRPNAYLNRYFYGAGARMRIPGLAVTLALAIAHSPQIWGSKLPKSRNSRWRLQRCRLCRSKELSRAFDWLDVMHPAAIPMRAEIDATRCGEMVEKVGHRMVRTMRGDEVIARKRSAPVAFAACHEDGFTRL